MREQNQGEESLPAPESTETDATTPDQDPDSVVHNSEAVVAEEVTELSVEEILRQERDQFEERWLRSVAELDNYRKRTRKELQDVRRFAAADVIRGLLEVLDNLERAVQAIQSGDAAADVDNIQAGILMVSQQLESVLAEQGLQKIEAENAEFDPRLHEAIQQVEVEGVPSGQITEVVQTGYLLHDLVLRPSRVVVAK
jgi:molecular chaperone GrpE